GRAPARRGDRIPAGPGSRARLQRHLPGRARRHQGLRPGRAREPLSAARYAAVAMSDSDWRQRDLAEPTPEHEQLARTLEDFVAREVEPQAAAHDRSERFNHALFRRAGELGLLGLVLPEEYGGSGLDATAAVQVF